MKRVILVVLVGVLTACGSSGGGKADEYVDAAMKGYDSSPAEFRDAVTESEARCLIKGLVDIAGVDNLEKAGITPQSLEKGDSPFRPLAKNVTATQAKEMAQLITKGKCFDFVDLVTSQMGTSSAFSKLSKTEVECFFDEVLRLPGVENAFAGSILGKTSDVDLSSTLSDPTTVRKILRTCDISEAQLSG